MRSVIISAALTGSITTKEDNEHLPITEDEIVSDAIACAEAGASIIHLHVRDASGNPSLSYDHYQGIIRKLREETDALICVSTSNYLINIADDDRLKLYNLDAELFSLAFGSLVRPHGTTDNSESFLTKSIELLTRSGRIPEIELFNFEMIDSFKKFLARYPIETPYVQYIFGSQGGMKATYANIANCIETTPKNWLWSAAGVGRMQLPVNVITLSAGCTTIRTGLEDNVYYEYKIKAKSNAQLVRRIVNVCNAYGCEIASPEIARRILKLSYTRN